jgi:XRE family transcriptional regulator, regulator of sulfur utilization
MKTEQELKKTLGQNVSIRRNSRGWTQEKLAEKAGFSKNTISDIENGDKFARAKTLVQLAKVLETEVYELLKPDNISPDNTIDAIAKYSQEVREAVDKIQSVYLENTKS